MSSKWKQLLSSRKFWAALVGLALVIAKTWLPDLALAEDQLAPALALLAAYILGVALEDGLARHA